MPVRVHIGRLLGMAVIAASAASTLPARAQPSFGDCAKSVERSGYVIYDMDLKGSTYKIDALKGGQEWDIKADRNCKIINTTPD